MARVTARSVLRLRVQSDVQFLHRGRIFPVAFGCAFAVWRVRRACAMCLGVAQRVRVYLSACASASQRRP
eukprot:2902419-Lingulodinium_polyedra.AAC.1